MMGEPEDDLDAFLDEIDTLGGGDEAGGSSSTVAADTAGSSSGQGAGAAPPPSAIISKPPAKVEPTKAVYASRPVRNDDPPKVPVEVPEPVAPVARPPTAVAGAGGTSMMPPPMMQPQMIQSQAMPPAAAPANPAPPPMYRVPPPPIQHAIPQQPAASGPPEGDKKRKVMRMAADKIWEDESLAEWPEDDYRLFCGNLGNEVDDSTLARTFNKYASFQKAKVIRDQRTKKSKGYGFVSLADPADFTRAIRELNGKYVGNRPIKLTKSEWQERQLSANIKKRPKMKPSSAKKHIL